MSEADDMIEDQIFADAGLMDHSYIGEDGEAVIIQDEKKSTSPNLKALLDFIRSECPDFFEHEDWQIQVNGHCMYCGAKKDEPCDTPPGLLEVLRSFPQRIYAKGDSKRSIDLIDVDSVNLGKTNIYVIWETNKTVIDQKNPVIDVLFRRIPNSL